MRQNRFRIRHIMGATILNSALSFYIKAKLIKRFGITNVTVLTPCYDQYKIESGLECKVKHANNIYQLWFPSTLDSTQLDYYLQQFYPELFI